MTAKLNCAIARIRRVDKTVVGAGFLIGSQYVLTCAHVVNDALGLGAYEPGQPDYTIELDFPLVALGQNCKAKVIVWREPLPLLEPDQEYGGEMLEELRWLGRGGREVRDLQNKFDVEVAALEKEYGADIAVLELLGKAPQAAQPAPLVRAEDLSDHPFQVFGFPEGHDHGVECIGILRSPQASGRVQMNFQQEGYPLEEGFSGGPVWDENLKSVVGMTVTKEARKEVKVSFMIPTTQLINAVQKSCCNSTDLSSQQYEKRNFATPVVFTQVSDSCLFIIEENRLQSDPKLEKIATKLKKIIEKRDINNVPTDSLANGYFNQLICKTLDNIAKETSNYFLADRCTIYFANQHRELSSIVAQGTDNIYISVPFGAGFAGKAAQEKELLIENEINRDSAEAREVKKYSKLTNYPINNMLVFPILDEEEVFSVVQLLNKQDGFNAHDEAKAESYIQGLKEVLLRFNKQYQIDLRLRNLKKFEDARCNIKKQSLDSLETTISMLEEVTKKFTGADQTTLWFFDAKKSLLSAKTNSFEEDLPLNKNSLVCYIARQAIQNPRQPKSYRTQDDFYRDKRSETAQYLDRKHKYRTYSLLCVPILNDDDKLIGVLQLINKKIKPEVNLDDHPQWREQPERWLNMFSKADRKEIQYLTKELAWEIERVKNEPDQEDEKLYDDLLKCTEVIKGKVMADRSTVFLYNDQEKVLWSITANQDEEGRYLNIEIPLEKGVTIAGDVFQAKKARIVKEFYKDERSDFGKKEDKKNDYRTYNVLAVPLLTQKGEVFAVIECLNKLKFIHPLLERWEDKVDHRGFTENDIRSLVDTSGDIKDFFEQFHDLQKTLNRKKLEWAGNKVYECQDPELPQVITNEAKELVRADRCTLWILNQEDGKLYPKLFSQGDSMRDAMPISIGEGYAGKAAQRGEHVSINYDLYEQEGSETAKEYDAKNQYRTYSTLCWPIKTYDEELVGVLQLLFGKETTEPNSFCKKKFSQNDEKLIKRFCDQFGDRLAIAISKRIIN